MTTKSVGDNFLAHDDRGSSSSSDSEATTTDEDVRMGESRSARKMWRQTSALRNDWMQRQISMVRADLRHFDPDREIGRSGIDLPFGLDLTWQDVEFSIQIPSHEDHRRRETLPILERCSGHIPAGELVAMMGPSGCGKTTLLDIIAKKKTTPHSGTVYLNGREVDFMFPRVSAYVDSSDTMPQHMTVREAVRFNFYLKGSSPVYKHFRQERQAEVLDFMLELVGLSHIADSKIGGDTVRGVSSGQRRRVTLARGLAAGVPLIFADEPTSGLSSTDAELCIKVLRIFAKKWGKTIIVVIHQPRIEVARLFDRLILLTSRPGRIVYNGPMTEATAYWKDLGSPVPMEGNPTDHFLDTVTPDAQGAQPEFFVQQFKARQETAILVHVEDALANPGLGALEWLQAQKKSLEIFGRMPRVRRSKYSVPFGAQLFMIADRKIRLMLRDPVILLMQVAVPLFEGAGLGFCFFGIAHKEPKGIMVITGWLNMLLMGVLFGGFTGVPQLIDDRILMQKEVQEALYSEWAHIVVAMVLDMVVTVVRNALFITVMFAMAELPWTHFGWFFLWIIVVGVTMDPIFKAAAAIAKDMQTATMSGLITVLFIAVFNGIGFVTKLSAPTVLRPLLYIMPSCRVAEQVAEALYGDDEKVWDQLHTFLGLERLSPWTCLFVCLAFFTTFNVVAALALRFIKQLEK